MLRYSSFQSTHPLGVRRGSTKNFTFSEMFQSTHPLGVRHKHIRSPPYLNSFNPRTHSGCDWHMDAFKLIDGRFQSTHPLGVRHKKPKISRLTNCFNPRTHSGCDGALKAVTKSSPGFNPRTHSGCDYNIINSS